MKYNDWSVKCQIDPVQFVCQNLFVWILNLLYTLRRLCFQLTSSAPPSMVRSRVKLHASRIFFSTVFFILCIFVDFLIFLHVGLWQLRLKNSHPNMHQIYDPESLIGRTERSRVRPLKQESRKAGQSKILHSFSFPTEVSTASTVFLPPNKKSHFLLKYMTFTQKHLKCCLLPLFFQYISFWIGWILSALKKNTQHTQLFLLLFSQALWVCTSVLLDYFFTPR